MIANNWIQLREPKNILSAMITAIPLMILCVLPSLKIIDVFSPFSLADFGITPYQEISIVIHFQDIVFFIGLSMVIIFIHELIHLVFVPDFLTSDKAFLGITYFGGFAYSEEAMSKSRLILLLLAPFVIISIILPGILGALNLLSPLVKIVVILHSISSSVDILSLILILTQVPAGAYLTCNGMRTYWKRIDRNIPGIN